MQAIGADEVAVSRENHRDGCHSRITNYFGEVRSAASGPQGFLVDIRPEEPDERSRYTMVPPHFHQVRQFQVVVGGDEPTLGKRPARPITFHYADPSTPYGPIDSGPGGVTFFTLRPRGDTNAHWMPGNRELMLSRAGRNIVTKLDSTRLMQGRTEVLIGPHDDGLASFGLLIGAGQSQTGPWPAGSGGQYYLVVRGSLAGERVLPTGSLLWVDAGESAPMLTAGSDGCELLVLQFPHDGATIERD
jgi:hypothetical protein